MKRKHLCIAMLAAITTLSIFTGCGKKNGGESGTTVTLTSLGMSSEDYEETSGTDGSEVADANTKESFKETDNSQIFTTEGTIIVTTDETTPEYVYAENTNDKYYISEFSPNFNENPGFICYRADNSNMFYVTMGYKYVVDTNWNEHYTYEMYTLEDFCQLASLDYDTALDKAKHFELYAYISLAE